jgi:hypothetical protein
VAIKSSGNPHSHAQNIAETSNASGDKPIQWPITKGSTNWAAT